MEAIRRSRIGRQCHGQKPCRGGFRRAGRPRSVADENRSRRAGSYLHRTRRITQCAVKKEEAALCVDEISSLDTRGQNAGGRASLERSDKERSLLGLCEVRKTLIVCSELY